jgi:glycosyltransferase involved in cell wall biosynthesis
MNIFYISSSSFPSRSANAVHVLSMCRALNNLNHKVNLFIKSEDTGSKDFISKNYEIDLKLTKIFETTPIFKRGTEFFIALKAIFKYFTLSNTDQKACHIIARNIFASFFLSILCKQKIIYETHISETGIIRKLIQRLLLRKKNVKTVVISNALKKILLSNFDLQQYDINVFHDGAFDTDSFLRNDTKLIKRKNYFSTIKDVDNFDFFVGYFGHLYKGRGINVIKKLAEKNSKSLFLVIGGQEEDIILNRQENSLNNLIFMGHLPSKNVKFVMSLMDVLLMPYQKSVYVSLKKLDTSKWMSPMKMFEYMSVGLPIISSNIPVLREVLTDRYNSLLVRPDDISEWSAALNKLKKDKNFAETLGKNAYRCFLKNHTWEIRAKGMLKILNDKK